MQMRGGREEGAHLALGSRLLSLVLQRTVKVLVAHNNAEVVAGSCGARKRRSLWWKMRRKDWWLWFLLWARRWVDRGVSVVVVQLC
jgi:hypothetical protein